MLHTRSNESRTQSEQTRILFDFVRAVFASPRTLCTNLSRRLRDVSFENEGPGELTSQRNSAPVANQVTLAAELSPISEIRASLPLKTARTEQLSTTARDQSI